LLLPYATTLPQSLSRYAPEPTHVAMDLLQLMECQSFVSWGVAPDGGKPTNISASLPESVWPRFSRDEDHGESAGFRRGVMSPAAQPYPLHYRAAFACSRSFTRSPLGLPCGLLPPRMTWGGQAGDYGVARFRKNGMWAVRGYKHLSRTRCSTALGPGAHALLAQRVNPVVSRADLPRSARKASRKVSRGTAGEGSGASEASVNGADRG